ncbi:MAG TPA: GNAT family N-acetyltransferase [Acidimicrobiales bacterium]|nr:GNAT family N-acetyltransferase [Acidimicrobiales bacterium]
MSIDVRAAVVADYEEIGRVHVETWQVCYRGQIPDEILDSLSVAHRADQWHRRLSADPVEGAVFVAEDDAGIVGFASCSQARGEYAIEGSGEIEAIYLDPRRWRSGIGSRLLQVTEARLKDDGYRDAMLWVLTANERARRFYEAKGWAFDGTEKMYRRDGHDIPELRYIKKF